MLLAEVVEVSSAVGATRSRNRKTALLADLLADAAGPDLPIVVAFLAGEPRQDRLAVGWSTVADLDVPPATAPTLTLADVDALLDAVAGVSGGGSRAARDHLLRDLFGRATELEQQYLRSLLLREVRQGALAGVMVAAVARAADVEEAAVRRAVMLSGNLAGVAAEALAGGAEALASYRLELFRPVEPMLASTTADVAAALSDLGTARVEAKLDGARVQVHRVGDEVRVYTRNLRDVTAQLPDVVAAARGVAAERVVLDGEAIALRKDGRPLPFQVTMGRFGSEADAASGGVRAAVPLAVRFFDVLHLDGDDVLDRPLRERGGALSEAVPAELVIDHVHVDNAGGARDFLARTLDAGHEGVMVKDLDAPYEAGRRGRAWQKVKPAHTLDLVVLAAEWGSGRRRGWLSNLHLGAHEPATGEFVMLGKTFKGLTDAMLAWQTERLLELETARHRHVVEVRPELVVEIALDGVQTSPRYPAGMALRFARVKGYRPDKRPADADTVATVRAVHEGRRRPDMGT